MSEENRNPNKQTISPESTHPGAPGRIFDRRHFLGGAALAGLAAATAGGTGLARATEPNALEHGPSTEHNLDNALSVRSFGARGDGKTDDTAAIQKALDTAGRQRGNLVLLPRGDYLVRGYLHVPKDVTLQGVFRAPHSRVWKYPSVGSQIWGSCLLAMGGKGKPDGTPLISLDENGTLYGLTIFYPEQTCPDPPVEYPWTVRQLQTGAAIVNVLLQNPWQGVDFGTVTGGRHYIRGLYGQPLKTGLFISRCYDVGRVEDVHFWPFWKNDQDTMAFTSREATAFLISRTDWQYMFNCFAICHKIGYHFVHTPSGDPNVVLTQCGSDEGAPGTTSTSVRVDGCQSWAGISFLNGQFGGTVQVGNTNEGPVKFTSCGFWGNDLDSVAVLAGSGLTTFIGCHFASWAQRNKKAPAIALRRGRLTVDGCEFQKSRRHIALNHIALDKGASAAVIMGNHFHGPARISNQIGSRASIATNATN